MLGPLRDRAAQSLGATWVPMYENQQEKEQYLREYSILKNEGKPFFPYAIAKDGMIATITIGVIV